MKLDLDNTSGKRIINAYDTDEIRVNGAYFRNNLIITPDKVIPDWIKKEFSLLDTEDFDAVLDDKPGIILLGTGAKFRVPPAKLRTDLFQLGIALEFMDTQAACRTYNILALENRRVVAALII